MGCTPSHSEIANTIARSGLKALNKPRSILRIDPGDKGIPLLVKGSSCYNTDEFHQYGIQGNDYLREKEDKLSEQDKSDNFQLSSQAHSDPQISREDKRIERTATDAEIVMSELIESQKHITEAIQIRKQSSCESEASAFIWDDKNESNAKQIPKKGKKQKPHKLAKQHRPSKIKEKSILALCETEKKVDFPELLVKAHQSAYAYLNPNLSKYETIIHMATEATQTQLFLQQMVSFLVLRFDEINQLLEEIANDGENLLKDVGGNLAWPAEKGDLKEHPDLLQQLLQYTVNKMQLLSGTLASLTSDALQETCSYLRSAASNLEGKLKAKQCFDEHLLRTVRLLEASTVGSSQSHGDDRTLYSEDSGIGVDNESLKEFSALSQHGGQASCDSCGHGHLSQEHTRKAEHMRDGKVSPGTAASHDCALERHFKDIFYSPVRSREGTSGQGGVPEGISTIHQYASLSKSHFHNSFHSDSTQKGEHFKICESTDFPSDDDVDDDEESTLEEDEDNTSLSEMGKDALPRRSLSLPTVTDNTQRQSIKRTENTETEEIIMKMKDAISEKIKFVPAKSRRKEWIEDESGKEVLATRPSTATGSQKTFRKQQRSRSEESLRSQAEDPTLLELQRTQKELSKRLEMFYGKDTDNNVEPWKSRTAPYLQDEQFTSRSSSKLKACLSKNFSILPNQDKVPSFMVDQNPAHQLDEKKGRKPLRATKPTQETSGGKEKEPPGAQMLNGSSCVSRQSVKKLIETFSPADGLVKASPSGSLGPIKCIRKIGLPVIPPTIPFQGGLAPLNLKHRISPVEDTNPSNTSGVSSSFPHAFPPAPAAELSKKDTKEETDEDIENLPPPPPEMLTDTSLDFSECEETARIEGNSSEDAKKPPKTEFRATKRSQVSPKMKASLQSIDLLPSKNISGPSVISNKGVRNTGAGDEKLQRYPRELNPTNVHVPSPEEILATQRKEAEDLYKQTHKIIPLQNPSGVSIPHSNSSESKEPNSPPTSVQYQKHGSADSLRRNKKGSVFARRVSPTRTPPSSPLTEKRPFNPPTHYRHSLQAFSSPQTSSPTMQRKPSPPSSPRVPSPPSQKKLPSPPPQRNPLSPPMGHKQSSPTPRRLLGSPAYRQDASPPPFPTAPSPPASPSCSYKGLRAGLEAGDEHQLSSSKRTSNVRSIFCPATSSLFEARPPAVPTKPTAEVASQPEASPLSQKSSLFFQQPQDRTRKLSLSAANPQPFVRRSFSDRRPGVQFRLPAPVMTGSEPALHQASWEESPRKASDTWNNSPCVPEIKESNRSASHPELYVVGQGLQRE
ncbi:photoreceptor cilium actin regulator [Falco biarmicus]|uniref:photoreceptor cilium actin regulator n=1 Tax=Falco cherrug TaxID=345164 RepID=UPI000392E479|nr:photoreceptor cilium actin regulator [Falco cherrug]XP_056213810.1 photoreceptor cilium actin regulator [Falco biarmicus]